MLASLILLAAAVSAYPTPSSNSTTTPTIVCGTSPSAKFSACQSVLENWTAAQLAESDKCSDAAYKVASVPGCSIYTSSALSDPALVKGAVESLMGCTGGSHGTVSGVATLSDGTRICIDDTDGCGDCFGHLNEESPRSLEARAVTPEQVRDATDKLYKEIKAMRAPQYGWYQDDREYFTGAIVTGLIVKFPELNAVICHTKHKANFEGTKNVDWFHRHIELDRPLGWGTVGYELYLGKKGTFERYGQGGFENWAWNGKVSKKGMSGAYLEFTTRT